MSISKKNNKAQLVTQYILQGGVRWYANCGFSHRSSVSFGQERSPKSAPQHAPIVNHHIKIKPNEN